MDVSHTAYLFLRDLQNLTHREHIISVIVVLFVCQVYSWDKSDYLRYFQDVDLVRLILYFQKYLLELHIIEFVDLVAVRSRDSFAERRWFIEYIFSFFLSAPSSNKFSKSSSVFALFKYDKKDEHTLKYIQQVVESCERVVVWGRWGRYAVEVEEGLNNSL